MDDGPDYFDVGWFKDSPSEIWGKNDLEGCGPLGAIVQIILLPLYILQFIVYSPFLLIYGIFAGIGKLFDSGSGEEVAKKNKQNAEQKKAQIGCPPNIYDFNGKHPTLEQARENNEASDLQRKQEAERKEFLEKLEANLRKDMAESAYWQSVSEDKRDRQISRYMKEAKLDLEKLGLDKASKLWLGFIKRSDAERASRQNPRSV